LGGKILRSRRVHEPQRVSTNLACLRNVEEAIRNLPPSEFESPNLQKGNAIALNHPESGQSPHAGEESARPLSINTPIQTLSGDAKRLLQKTGDTISKPLNALGRIFTEALDGTENKFISLPGSPAPLEPGQEQRENMVGPDTQYSRQHPSGVGPLTNIGHEDMLPIQTPYKPRVRRGPSPSSQSVGMPSGSLPIYGGGYAGPEDTSSRPASGPYTNQSLVIGPSQPYSSHDPAFQSLSYSPSGQHLLPPRVQLLAGGGGGGSFGGEISRVPTPSLDFAGVQAEIDTAHEQAARAAKETLRQIFPAVDSDVVDWVLEAKEGDLGKSIEALLEISSGT